MEVQVNLWAVLVAALSSMIVGMIYYAGPVFGDEWKRLAKIDDKEMQKGMAKVMPGVFVAALITAYVIGYVTFLDHQFFGNSWISAGAQSALILWLGLSATTTFVHNVFEQKPSKLTYISLGNRLITILVMGLVIGWLHP